MNPQNAKFQVVISTVNLALWFWVVGHMKQHGDHLGGPHLIALIAAALALLLCYRSVLTARRTASVQPA